MSTISAFLFLTVNGFYKGLNDDISWHDHGEEGDAYSREQLESGNILLFGRKTYELMYAFWPAPMAYNAFPEVATKMNQAEKIVLSNSLTIAEWQNTSVLSGDAITQIALLKNTPGKNVTLLGSGSIAAQLAQANLIDTFQFLVDPLAIGRGVSLFENLNGRLELELINSKVFPKSGKILLIYNRKQAGPKE